MAFQYSEEQRDGAIADFLKLFPEEKRGKADREARSVLNLFEGQDHNALGVLYRAAEGNRFNEYLGKLRDYHEKEGKDVPVEFRGLPIGMDVRRLEKLISPVGMNNPNFPPTLQKLQEHPESVRMELFFWNCYEDIKKN